MTSFALFWKVLFFNCEYKYQSGNSNDDAAQYNIEGGTQRRFFASGYIIEDVVANTHAYETKNNDFIVSYLPFFTDITNGIVWFFSAGAHIQL